MTSFTDNSIIRRYIVDYGENRFFYLSNLAFSKYKELSSKIVYNNGYDIYHDDPILIEIIEELGPEKSSGKNSLLKIFEVKAGTVGVVYNPMKPQLSLSHDGKELFKKLSGYDYSDNVLRHDKYLVEVYEKLGDYACCYPIDFIDITYIPEDKIDTYEINRENDCEEIIFPNIIDNKNNKNNKNNKIYGLFFQKNMFEKSLNAISFSESILENLIIENKDKYNIEEIDIHILDNTISKENQENKNNDYSFIQKGIFDDYSKLNNNNFYGFIKNIEQSFPLIIQDKSGISNNSSLDIFIQKEILLYIDNYSNYELLKSINKFSNSLSENNILFDKYYSNGIVNKE